jgi:head-tail adaptor
MSIGKLNSFINIITTEPVKDAEGFTSSRHTTIASVRAYMETRNTSAKWERIIGNAAFSSVSTVFRFRKIPGLTVTTSHFIAVSDERYNIVNVEDVRGRGMYVEVLCEKLEGSVK